MGKADITQCAHPMLRGPAFVRKGDSFTSQSFHRFSQPSFCKFLGSNKFENIISSRHSTQHIISAQHKIFHLQLSIVSCWNKAFICVAKIKVENHSLNSLVAAEPVVAPVNGNYILKYIEKEWVSFVHIFLCAEAADGKCGKHLKCFRHPFNTHYLLTRKCMLYQAYFQIWPRVLDISPILIYQKWPTDPGPILLHQDIRQTSLS